MDLSTIARVSIVENALQLGLTLVVRGDGAVAGPGAEVDGEGGHRTMVPSELQILVLFYDQGGAHLFARTSKFGR